MQTLYTYNRQQGGIRMVVLDNLHLRAATTFNVSSGFGLSKRLFVAAQQSQSRRATCVRLSKAPCGQHIGIGRAPGVVSVRSLHRKANSLDVSVYSALMKIFCITYDYDYRSVALGA